MSKCPNCGAPMQDGVCTYCHYSERKEEGPTITVNRVYQTAYVNSFGENLVSPKSKLVAFLLCFFFGYFGAHKFYVGKTNMGVVYLFTVGLFGFGWLADIFSILSGSFKDKDNLPLKK